VDVEDTRIYTVFISSGVQHFEAKRIKPLTNEELLTRLRGKCEGVEFIVGSAPHDIERIKREFDGVLIFGGLRNYGIALSIGRRRWAISERGSRIWEP